MSLRTGNIAILILLSILLTACSNVNDENAIYPYEERGPLTILDSCPRVSQEKVSVDAIIEILFNKPLDPAKVNLSSIMLGNGRWLIAGNVFYSDRLVTYVPSESLDENTRYTLYVTNSLRDEDGFAMTVSVHTQTFTTGNPGQITCR